MAKMTNIESHFVPSTPAKTIIIFSDVISVEDARDSIMANLPQRLYVEDSIMGFPTIKIFRKRGKAVQEYNGPREADGIVTYLKKQSGHASFEIKLGDDDVEVVADKKVVVVGVFHKLSGSEFVSFLATAEKLHSDYDFAHTSNAKLLPRGEYVMGHAVTLVSNSSVPECD